MTLPLCVRIDAEDERSAQHLRLDGWREIEILETWASPVCHEAREEEGILAAKPTDVDRCAQIAVRAFIHDRLHKDPHVTKKTADEAKDNWVRVAFTDRKKKIFVTRSATGEVTGFIIVGRSGSHAFVDLLAVDPDHAKEGLGGRLLRHAMMVMDLPMEAGTQSDNKEAKILYKRNGFEIVRRQRTFHKAAA